jgi:hypothetical protein
MSNRRSLFQSNPFIGWFQYGSSFKEFDKPPDTLPRSNPFVGTFDHLAKDIKKLDLQKTSQLDIEVNKLLLYYKTLHTKPKIFKDVSTQTEVGFALDDLYFIVPR